MNENERPSPLEAVLHLDPPNPRLAAVVARQRLGHPEPPSDPAPGSVFEIMADRLFDQAMRTWLRPDLTGGPEADPAEP